MEFDGVFFQVETSRVFRLDPGPGVQWYDVDYPDVITLREKIFPTRPRYHLIATSATEPSWLDQIPADRPVLFLAEGISMYLTEDEGVALLRRSGFRTAGGAQPAPGAPKPSGSREMPRRHHCDWLRQSLPAS